MTEHSSLSAQLRRRLAELTGRVDALEAELGHPLDADSEEQAIDLEDDEVLEGLEQASLDEIAQIKAALARIRDGSYGICASCGEQIGDARLKAMPAATRCINCAD